jgi:hypothetical protein
VTAYSIPPLLGEVGTIKGRAGRGCVRLSSLSLLSLSLSLLSLARRWLIAPCAEAKLACKMANGKKSYLTHGWTRLDLVAEGAEKDNKLAKQQLANTEGAMSHTPSRQGVTHPCCRGATRLGCSYHQVWRDQQMHHHQGALATPHPLPPPSPGAAHPLTQDQHVKYDWDNEQSQFGSFGAACLAQTGLRLKRAPMMWSCNMEKTRSRCAHATQD